MFFLAEAMFGTNYSPKVETLIAYKLSRERGIKSIASALYCTSAFALGSILKSVGPDYPANFSKMATLLKRPLGTAQHGKARAKAFTQYEAARRGPARAGADRVCRASYDHAE